MAIQINGTTVIDNSRVLTNLGAAITPAQGGTGVTSVGTTGNVLTSNGTAWVSTEPPRNIPQSGAAKTASYTLAVGDVGEFIQIGAGGSITIPDATFAAGDAVSLFNNTAGDITVTCSITTAYISGTDADVATVTLATRGLATILFVSGTVCVISGNVS